ncbi:laccase B [Dichomitus squalens LYAD-421 SS1]|uniref:laccase n=1 Tax=Dichomitus squalens (strain LYAD-421) TaxID=732165 RepID=R7SPI3_DICSQ|nr:laccase B [Dichomitus squalens LYAD-421 SS1]EJF58089.1 laccase B [Dichomitus squalens LYAD-421 SS1]
MSRILFRNIALVFALGNGALASIGPVTDLIIANKDISPDGSTRPAVLAGGSFPGPLIKGNKGDNFRINVIDKLENETMLTATSIHWHGLFQHTTNWADGPAFVTQCPITKDHSFLYNFNVPDQAGTFWYHSHLMTQYCDGLRGPLVVYDPHDPHKHLYDVDNDDTVITLADWYHQAAVTVQTGVPLPDSTLFNGLGRYIENPTSELAVINVEHGKRYRFRLVNIACDPNYNFTIDNHSFTVIEADGENTQPQEADSLVIFSAQRYSIVVDANQAIDNYWIRAIPDVYHTGGNTTVNGINSAILRYKGAPKREPNTTQTPSLRPLAETDLHPLSNPAAPGKNHTGGVDYALNLHLNFTGTNFTINSVPFVPPELPVLLQILDGNKSAQSLLPKGSVYNLPPRSSIELSFTIDEHLVGDPHPFHLHGHSFSVVRSAGNDTYNYANPVRRDVVSTGGPGDNVTIRFRTDNPGPWFLHCHIDWHLQAGFAIVFAEDSDDVPAVDPVPEAWRELCPTFYAGNETHF